MAAQNIDPEPLADVSQFLSGEYLKATDVKDGPLTFAVRRVEVETFEARGGKKAEKKVVLTLDGDPLRKLPLNQTNLQTLKDAWGRDARRWIGLVFDAYYDKTVRNPSGDKSGGLRVRVRDGARAVAGSVGARPNGTEPAADDEPSTPIPL